MAIKLMATDMDGTFLDAHPEIQSLADQIIGHHDTGSVMSYMEEIVCPSN
ncbi:MULTISPECIES: hypothetical protein [unclassified Streptococcus]|nr:MULTISPECIES: hypothetical protein [unclassified Streptococcus]